MAMTRRVKRVIVAAAALIVVVLVGWWVIRVQIAAAVHPARIGMSQVLARLAPSQPGGSGFPSASPAGSRVAAPERDSFELCGLGRFTREELDEGSAGLETLGRLGEDAMRRTVERLKAQPDERSRAVAEMIVWSTDEAAAGVAARDSLARRAAVTSDAWVYALAHRVCARQARKDEAGACQLISVARWAQLEPDNAMPWFFAAAEALRRKDEPGVVEAMYRASQARSSDVRFGQSVLVTQAQIPADVAPVVGFGIDVGLVGIDAADALPGYQVVTQYCAKEALGDPNRRAVCEGLATMLVDRGTTLLDMSIGLGLGKRLDWPAERLAAIEELRNAINGTEAEFAAVEASSPAPLDCPAVQAQRDRLRQVAALGEVEAYRRIVDAAPEGRAGLVAKQRERMIQMQRQFAAEEASKEAASAPAN